MIEMDPEIFRAFSNSTQISSAHGNGSQLLKAGQRDEGIKQRCWNSGKSRIQEKRPSTIRMSELETWKWNWLVSRRLCKARTKRSIRPSPSYSMSSQLPTRMRMQATSWSRWWMPVLLS